VFNAFEYYFSILEHNPNFYLYILNSTQKEFENIFYPIFENRYYLDDIDYKKNIRIIPKQKLIYEKFDKVLVLDYGTIWRTKGFLNAKDITVICEKHTDDPNYMFNKDLYKVTYFAEMPFVYSDHRYRMKLGFNRFKKLGKSVKRIYINSPYNDDFSFVKGLDLPNKEIIYKTDDHLTNLFEQFDEYVYYHANKWFDPHPRLVLECTFYDKKIHYYNTHMVKDGSYYRYRDIKENKLKNRTLNKDDEIVQRFI